MSHTVVKGNLLNVTDGLIVHQVNTAGAMGAGVALGVKGRWPDVYEEYRAFVHERGAGSPSLLGLVQIEQATDQLYVANLFGQHLKGPKGSRRTSYDATVDGWKRVAAWLRTPAGQSTGGKVSAPYNMGCGLGGGDWGVYSAIVDAILPGVTFYKL